MSFPLSASATVVVVKGYWWRDDGSGVPRAVTATPAVTHVTSVSGRGVIDLSAKSVTPETDDPYWEIEVVASNDPDLAPSCPWTFRFSGYDGAWTVIVPYDAITGTDGRPEVWLTDLDPLVEVPPPQTTDYFYTKTEVDQRLADHVGMNVPGHDPHPQYAMDGEVAVGLANISGDGDGNLIFSLTNGETITVPVSSIGSGSGGDAEALFGSAPFGFAPFGGAS